MTAARAAEGSASSYFVKVDAVFYQWMVGAIPS